MQYAGYSVCNIPSTARSSSMRSPSHRHSPVRGVMWMPDRVLAVVKANTFPRACLSALVRSPLHLVFWLYHECECSKERWARPETAIEAESVFVQISLEIFFGISNKKKKVFTIGFSAKTTVKIAKRLRRIERFSQFEWVRQRHLKTLHLVSTEDNRISMPAGTSLVVNHLQGLGLFAIRMYAPAKPFKCASDGCRN